ncbi:MAG: hypothetical protein WA855_02490 [Candidatus Acidiferrales bacterium]
MKAIFLYKPPETENFTNSWIYYRVDSVEADEPAGSLFAPIQVCKVSWPTFTDIPAATDTPGITGLESAHDHMRRLVKGQWGVDHEESVFIGFLEEASDLTDA